MDAFRLQAVPRVRRPRERDRLRRPSIGHQEVPRGADERARRIRSDVARPDDGRADRSEDRDEPQRLRIVDHDDVARSHRSTDVDRVGTGDVVVMPALGVAERTTVAEHAVEPVMDPLRDREELGVTVDHDPARVDPIVDQVSQAGPEQFRDAAARGRRVDVPDRPALEDFTSGGETQFVASTGIRPRDRTEAPCGPGVNGDRVHQEGRSGSQCSCPEPTGSIRTRASTITVPRRRIFTGLQSISTISGCISAIALTRRTSSSSAGTSAFGAPR